MREVGRDGTMKMTERPAQHSLINILQCNCFVSLY